jgi:hypothetical protein
MHYPQAGRLSFSTVSVTINSRNFWNINATVALPLSASCVTAIKYKLDSCSPLKRELCHCHQVQVGLLFSRSAPPVHHRSVPALQDRPDLRRGERQVVQRPRRRQLQQVSQENSDSEFPSLTRPLLHHRGQQGTQIRRGNKLKRRKAYYTRQRSDITVRTRGGFFPFTCCTILLPAAPLGTPLSGYFCPRPVFCCLLFISFSPPPRNVAMLAGPLLVPPPRCLPRPSQQPPPPLLGGGDGRGCGRRRRSQGRRLG